MRWQTPPLGNRMPSSATPENFLAISNCCFISVAKERSPKILVEINPGLCSIQENSMFFLRTLNTSDRDNMKYEISSQILYHVIPLVKICHP